MMTGKVVGRERLAARMRQMPKRLQAEMQAGVVEGAEELAALQRSMAPKASGALARSIRVTGPSESTPAYSQPGGGGRVMGPLQAMVTAGDDDVRYPHLVEYGVAAHINKGQFAGTKHPGTTAQPFFWPAYRLLRKRIASRIRRGVSKALRREAGLSK